MRNNDSEPTGLLEIVTAAHQLLSRLDSTSRSRAMQMLALAAEERPAIETSGSPPDYERRSRTWMSRYALSEAMLAAAVEPSEEARPRSSMIGPLRRSGASIEAEDPSMIPAFGVRRSASR